MRVCLLNYSYLWLKPQKAFFKDTTLILVCKVSDYVLCLNHIKIPRRMTWLDYLYLEICVCGPHHQHVVLSSPWLWPVSFTSHRHVLLCLGYWELLKQTYQTSAALYQTLERKNLTDTFLLWETRGEMRDQDLSQQCQIEPKSVKSLGKDWWEKYD